MTPRNAAGSTAGRSILEAFFARLLAPSLLAGCLLVPSPAAAGEDIRFEATYSIIIAGLTVGRAEAETRFTPTGYAAAISGSTRGISRLVSDARASLAGSGRILADRLVPATYNLETSENGDETRVKMALRGGAITDLTAEPPLKPKPDRIPVTATHKRDILDPLSAFLIRLNAAGTPDGKTACGRTINIFDGWQRYDIALSYKETRKIEGRGEGYSGPVFVCGARYVPIAGHRPKAVRSMTENKRLEVWLAPLGTSQMMAPYKIVIGASVGDLVVLATRFKVEAASDRASTN